MLFPCQTRKSNRESDKKGKGIRKVKNVVIFLHFSQLPKNMIDSIRVDKLHVVGRSFLSTSFEVKLKSPLLFVEYRRFRDESIRVLAATVTRIRAQKQLELFGKRIRDRLLLVVELKSLYVHLIRVENFTF
jgi:hypothetical protein